MVRVSVVIPIHNMDNGKFFLQRNLDSILKQTFRDFEVVITDDSESKEIEDWITESYMKNIDSYPENPRIRYISNVGAKGMANNSNFAIDQAYGQLIKILYQDDYFYDERSLWDIVQHFTPYTMWMVTPCVHDSGDGRFFNEHMPYYSESENTIGSPSVLTIRREITDRFDPQFGWLLDLDLYKRLYRKYGKPKILSKVNTVILLGPHQVTYKLSIEAKAREHSILAEKYT